MKILFVTEFFPEKNNLEFTGGVETFSYYLVRELSRRHQVTILCRKSGVNQQNTEKWSENLKVIRIGLAAGRIDTGFMTIPARFYYTLAGLFLGLKEDYDLVQGNNFVTYLLAYLLGLFKGRPTVAWYPDVFVGRWITLTGLLSGLVGEISERLSLRFPWSKVVAMSNATAEKLASQGVPEDKIKTIYGGVDTSIFKQINAQKNGIFTISCVTRLVSYKRVDLLIRAVKILKDRGVKLQVEIMGDGPQRSKLESLADKLGVNDSVYFHGRVAQQEIVKILNSSQLFCLPSEVEGFGLVTIEAASCGLPYLVTDTPVLKEVTRNGLGGTYFKKGDTANLAHQIASFKRDPKLLKLKSGEALNLAKEYSWEKIAAEFEDLYYEITRKPLRILMLVDAWFPHVGGGQIHAWELARGLAKLNNQVTVFTRNLGCWDEEFPGVKVIRVGHFKPFANPVGRIEYLMYALVYSLFAGYDILHAHAFSPGLLVPIIKFFRHKPSVFTVHGRGVKIAGLGTGGGFLQDLIFYKILYDLEITVAKNTLTDKVAAKRLVVIPNGVDTEKFAPAIRDRKEIKRILYVGRLSEEKGVDLLIAAFKKLHRQGLKLDIVGEGAENNKLHKMVAGAKITFWGRLEGEKLVERFKNADLLVMPSRTEGHPLTLFEAWAAKLPVLVTDVGDNAVYIKDDQNGYLCEANADSISQRIKAITQSDNLAEVSQAGFDEAVKFSWDKIARATLQSYQRLFSADELKGTPVDSFKTRSAEIS